MLALFKESAMHVMNKETGAIVPFHMFYDALEQFLDHSHKGVISHALDNDYLNPDHAEECFDVNVLKTLFMIKYVKEIKANLENITSLMVDHMDNDRMELSQKVEDALKRLIRQTLVQKNGDLYVFLTNEEQEINRAIQAQPVDPGEITAKVSELIFDGIFGEKNYRYPAFNGRYAFGFNQVVDDKPYKAGKNYDITLKILTPNSDEIADDTTMRLLSAQSHCVLVVLPDDRAFLDEIRSSLQIEKFIRFDTPNTVTKYEQIKDAKKVELRERSAAARLFLQESLKSAVIYVNGDRVQTTAKEVSPRINDAIGKLVASVYHKLSYIDTAMNEADIKKMFHSSSQQLSLTGTNAKPNSLALHDVSDYIAVNTSRHTKTSMKSLLDRFMKAPYGFVEADVQWLVARLFKDGEIAFYVNSEPVTLLSKSADEIIRFITRKEFNERLMTEKRVRASEKQKKAVREVMKELFGVSPSSDDDDAVMSSFIGYAGRLKNDLEKLEIRYQSQPLYPGKSVIQQGKKLLNDVAQMKNANEFFASVNNDRDVYLDFAEDYEPVKKFFSGDQITIFDRAIRLMAIYDDSRTFIVNKEMEAAVEKIKFIMKKSAPYSDIFKLPGLLDEFSNIYSKLLDEMKTPIEEAIDEARKRVLQELEGKLCEGQLRSNYVDRFQELHEKASHCNNVATLQNIKIEADALKVRCLNEIADMESKLQAQKIANEEKKGECKTPQPGLINEGGNSYGIGDHNEAQAAPVSKAKKQRTISIKTINTETTWQLETKEDVKRYVSMLEKKLMEELREDTIIHVEF